MHLEERCLYARIALYATLSYDGRRKKMHDDLMLPTREEVRWTKVFWDVVAAVAFLGIVGGALCAGDVLTWWVTR